MAPQAANATVPPNNRKEFRVAVTTAISFLSTLACMAIRPVCKVWPDPRALKIWYPTILAMEVVGDSVEKSPQAIAQMANPPHMQIV